MTAEFYDERNATDLRFMPNLLPDAEHYIWDDANVKATQYIWSLRDVCFANPRQIGVRAPKPAPQVQRAKTVAAFTAESDHFFYPSKEEALCNRHLFDICGNTVFRIVGERRELMWTEDTQPYLIDYGSVSQRSFSSVLCHRTTDLTVAVGQDRRIYTVDHATGQIACKSGKMFNTLFASPSIAWVWPTCPALFSLAVGRLVTFYDFMVEEKFVDLPVRKPVRRVATSSQEASALVAVHYEDATMDIFDLHKPSSALLSVERSTIGFDWQPSSKKLSLLGENGRVETLVVASGTFEPLAGLPVSRDTTGVFWVDEDELYLTSSAESGLDSVDYFRRNFERRFVKTLHWSTEEDLLCVRVDCGSRALYVSSSDCKIYGLPLPEKPKITKRVPLKTRLVSIQIR